VLRAQILLDRAAFSPGEIDDAYGPNLRSAIHGFQTAHQLPATDELGLETWALLEMDSEPVLIPYEISAEDVAGPFEEIPADIMERAKLQALGFQSPLELLGEKFHVSPRVLRLLNKDKAFDKEGEQILVPNVGTPGEPIRKAASILVRKSDMTVSALDGQGMVMAQFPASAGSEHDPLPIGKWKIKGVARNPVFHYNPKLFWDAEPGNSAAKIAAGPNNPVGGLDRPVQTALRDTRHAGTVASRPCSVTRVHPPDELGRDAAGGPGFSRHDRDPHGVKL